MSELYKELLVVLEKHNVYDFILTLLANFKILPPLRDPRGKMGVGEWAGRD